MDFYYDHHHLVWYVFSCSEGKTQITEVWKQSSRENIWT